MNEKHIEYIKNLGLNIDDNKISLLDAFAELVWQKKDDVNITSVKTKDEIYTRHLLDGAVGVSVINTLTPNVINILDAGAGSGYIGIVIKILLGNKVNVILAESVNRKCVFMNWAIIKLGLKNIKILNYRLTEAEPNKKFDIVIQRAMGKIDDILPICSVLVANGGYFLSYLAEETFADDNLLQKLNMELIRDRKYPLPDSDKQRKIAIYKKN
jgi:16S rRNA (guanine527-N7)-methyltransferase